MRPRRIGLTASGYAGALAGVASTATLAGRLAFLNDTRRTGAFFGAFFLIALVFLTAVAFLRLATLLTSVFLRFALPLCLAFVLVANTTSLETCALLVPVARSQRRVAPSSGPFHRHSGPRRGQLSASVSSSIASSARAVDTKSYKSSINRSTTKDSNFYLCN